MKVNPPRYILSLLLLVLSANLLPAQGVSAPWDISPTIAALSEQAGRLLPVLDQLTPQQWESQGAPSTYTEQWRSVRNEVGYAMNAAEALRKQPEKLSTAFEVYFRLQAVETGVHSLVEGVRRYQNVGVADLLSSVLGANSGNRDHLRQYITELTETRERELQVMDQEAQRCRDMLLRQPAKPKPSTPPAK